MLSAFGPFVMDMYLPTLPAMTGYFNTSSSMVQLGLTASMIGLAAGQLVFGPVSDKFGRRSSLLAAMILFLLSTAGCILSETILQFVALRLVQGIAGAGGVVISRSIAADKYAGHELAAMLAIIGAINGIATVAAPPLPEALYPKSADGMEYSASCSFWESFCLPEASISTNHCLPNSAPPCAGATYSDASEP